MGIPIISDLFESTIGKVVDKALNFIPDPETKAKAAAEIHAGVLQVTLAQIAVNQSAAGHQSIFVAGARSFVIWTGGVAFAYQLVMQPFLTTMLIAFNPAFPVEKLPKLDLIEIGKLLFGLLGVTV